uniref:Dynein axonemal assembly factor 2 n=1 Tax=Scleropages formosus TaxID=113540 RepID=A0A8C9VZE4_SCLFO
RPRLARGLQRLRVHPLHGAGRQHGAAGGPKPIRRPAGREQREGIEDQVQGGAEPKRHPQANYRSYIDLQDYTCARDSASGPRPKEMVVTIDLPLLKSAGDADLNVTERRLLLQSQSPAYRLELPLPYPVDENKGQAKFIPLSKVLPEIAPVKLSTCING